MDRKREQSNPEEELVITPGGPRLKRLVKQVGPKETVCFDNEGKGRISKKRESE